MNVTLEMGTSYISATHVHVEENPGYLHQKIGGPTHRTHSRDLDEAFSPAPSLQDASAFQSGWS